MKNKWTLQIVRDEEKIMAINHTEEISFCGQNRNWIGSSLLRNVLQMYFSIRLLRLCHQWLFGNKTNQ